ncbi:hypothetical protein E3T46_05620 [Cryobacterium sp. Hh11]|uniref:DsrE family protein n=1 Tax=Cryobacterium sp. Hh11 TaxID=2555868 RepID=UPI00106CE602|nr:hypothetical protein [Cryobacterium sp. Hh11]TFD52347.1 hypothetical protein E3T46_05620 [Cryobacterium sp. Hh11]
MTAASDENTAPNRRPRLLLHVFGSDEASVTTGLQVARNAHHGFGSPSTIVLVIQGRAVQFVAAAAGLNDDIGTVVTLPGVSVVACGNSLRSVDVEPTNLASGVHHVPAAVVFLTQRQLDGWAYIRI